MNSPIRIWNNKLYNLQLEAPDPIPVLPKVRPECTPLYYGNYYHGKITREEARLLLLDKPTGSFLVRESSSNHPDTYALVIKYRDEIKTFLVFYDSMKCQHFVGEKLFDTMELLVKDGLIHFHVEHEGADVLDEIASASVYETAPYRLRYELVKPSNNRQSITIDSSEANPHRPIRCTPNGEQHYNANSNKRISYAVNGESTITTAANLKRASLAEINNKSTVEITNPTNVKHNDALALLQSRYAIPVPCLQPSGDDQCDSASDLSSRVTLPLPRPKQHCFKVHTFIGAHWCDYCNNFLWGLKSQGMKCSECGFQAHKKCSERSNAEADCLPDMKFMRRVFAVDLISLVRAENRTVPIVLEKCVTEIENRDGLYFEGLYRIPGNQDNVEELKRLFDKNAEAVSLTSDARVSYPHK